MLTAQNQPAAAAEEVISWADFQAEMQAGPEVAMVAAEAVMEGAGAEREDAEAGVSAHSTSNDATQQLTCIYSLKSRPTQSLALSVLSSGSSSVVHKMHVSLSAGNLDSWFTF